MTFGIDAATGEPTAARAAWELAPWRTDARPWLRRFVAMRFAGLVPLIGFLLWAAVEDRIDSPTAVFLLILVVAAVNLALLVLSRRDSDAIDAAAPAMLVGSLLFDCAVLVGLLSLTGGVVSPLTLFLVLPVLGAAMALSERATCAVAVFAAGALLFVAHDQVASASASSHETKAVIVGEAAGARVTAWATSVLLGIVTASVLWYRRRGRFLESRLSTLESERSARRPAHGGTDVRSESVGSEEATISSIASAFVRDLDDSVTVIRGRAERIRDRMGDVRATKELHLELNRVLRATDRLEDVRVSLGALGRIDPRPAGKCTVFSVLKAEIDALDVDLERSGVRLALEGAENAPNVAASHDEVRVILVRLLAAIQAAAAGRGTTRVQIRVETNDESVAILVRDSLPAPPPEDEWFDPAYSPAARPSLGFALAVVRRVAERRGGGVEVRRRDHDGLQVRVELPIVGSKRKKKRRRASEGSVEERSR